MYILKFILKIDLKVADNLLSKIYRYKWKRGTQHELGFP